MTNINNITKQDLGLSEAQLVKDYVSVDLRIKRHISELTELDSQYWSAPLRNRRESGHSYFQYPAMMVPSVQRDLINVIKSANPEIERIIDPFVGAGTSLVAASYFGLNCFGQDINPLAVLVSQVRMGPFYKKSLAIRADEVLSLARSDRSKVVETDMPNHTKWFKPEVSSELSALRRAIRSQSHIWARRFFWVTLAEAIRLTSNDRTSTFKLHARPKDEIERRNFSPIEMFADISKRNIEDLGIYYDELANRGLLDRGRYKSECEVVIGDTSKHIISSNGDNKFDLLVTSPPYGDNLSTITYGQHSYLPLHWIDLSDIKDELDNSSLRTTQEIDRRSLGGRSKHEMNNQEQLLRLESSSLAAVLDDLESAPKDRKQRVIAFYGDFRNSIENILASLNPNAYMIWTVGNRRVGNHEIPNDEVVMQMMEYRGSLMVSKIKRSILNKRMAHRNAIASTMKDETILIARKVN